jgi:hypothetical protein
MNAIDRGVDVKPDTAARWAWFWLGLATVITVVGAWVILRNVVPWLLGPAPFPPEWEWPWDPIPWSNYRTWIHLGVAVAYVGVVALLLGPDALPWKSAQSRHRWGVVMAVIFFALFQLALGWARKDSLLDMVIFRTYAPPGNGYFMTAVRVDSVWDTLNHYQAAMPNFPHDRPQTHPPGIFIYYAAWIGLFERLPGFSAWFAPVAREWALEGRDWVQLQDAYIPAAFFSGWVQILSAALAPIVVYALMGRLDGGRKAPSEYALAGAMLLPLLPSVGSFYTHWDTNYLLLTSAAWFFALRAQDRIFEVNAPRFARWLDWLWSGLLLSLLTWLSFGNAVFGVMVGLHLLWRQAVVLREGSLLRAETLAPFVIGALIMAAGAMTPWLLAWAGWGMNYLGLIDMGMEMHYKIVTSARDYSIWRWMNLVDFSLWIGFGVSLLAVVSSVWLVWHWKKGTLEANLAGAVVIFWGVLLVLNFSGTARGEIGRLWIFLMPFPLMFVLGYLKSYWQRLTLTTLLTITAWVMGHALRAV